MIYLHYCTAGFLFVGLIRLAWKQRDQRHGKE